MGFFDGYKIKKALGVLLAAQAPNSPQVVQAITRLKEIGKTALPQCVDALVTARNTAVIEDLLVAFLDKDSFSAFVALLAHPNPTIASSIVQVFIRSTRYDPNRLLPLLTDTKTPKAALGKILTQRKDHLNLRALLTLLTSADRENRAVLSRVLELAVSEAMLPDLIRAARHDDPLLRLHMTRLLARFSTEAVRDTLSSLLLDPHADVRQAALEGLANLKIPLDVGPVCQMLRDPEPAIQTKSKEILIQTHDPETVRHLVELLQDEAAAVRQRAVEVLNGLHVNGPIRLVLESLRGREWWAKVRAFEALCMTGEAALFEAVVALLQDEDEYIRRSAEEIVRKDDRVFQSLLQALEHPDAAVRQRTLDALIILEDRRAVPALLRLLEATPALGPRLIPVLAKLGDRQALPALMACTTAPDPALRILALQALPPLTDAAHAEQVWKVVMAVRESAADPALKAAANAAANALVGKGVLARSNMTNSMAVSASMMAASPFALNSTAPLVLLKDSIAPAAEMILPDEEPDAHIDADRLVPNDMLVRRYRVIRHVGKGGFGSVILVEDTEVGEEIILKFLHRTVAADHSMIERFKHELRYARRITHENVIRIHELLTLNKSYAISMEYFQSHSLAEELKAGPLTLKRGLKIVWDICRGMHAAHQVGVVHRDLKPPNILINDDGLVKVVDFGLASMEHPESRLTRTGILLGTPTYMAPEQVRARTIDARTDIYSLGVIMYELFTGKPPYIADDPMAVLFQHVEGNPKPPRTIKADIPPAVEAIILKAMWVDPVQRFQTMDELRRSIYALSRQEAL